MLTNNELELINLCHQPVSLLEGFSYNSICDNLPHSHLLRQNAIFQALQDKKPILLSHQTKYVKEIQTTGILKPGMGCLGSVVYTIPVYTQSQHRRRDNFADIVLIHQDKKTAEQIGEILIQIDDHDTENIYGFNYLLAGRLLYHLAQGACKADEVQRSLTQSDNTLESADFKSLTTDCDTKKALNSLARISKKLPFFAHIYYEALSQILVLSSTDKRTKSVDALGEFNAKCFYTILAAYKDISSDRYDSSAFAPSYSELLNILTAMKDDHIIDINTSTTFNNLLINIRQIIQSLGDDKERLEHIAGQVCLSTGSRALMQHFNATIAEYRKMKNIGLVINTATLKQEIGFTGVVKARYRYLEQPLTLAIGGI